MECFSYIKLILHSFYDNQLEGGYNPLDLPSPTLYNLYHQLEGGSNPPMLSPFYRPTINTQINLKQTSFNIYCCHDIPLLTLYILTSS